MLSRMRIHSSRLAGSSSSVKSTGLIGPVNTRMTSPAVMLSGGLDRMYPPYAPRMLFT